MPVRFLILRFLLAVMCIGFAHMWGRGVGRREPVRIRRGTGVTSWTLRTLAAAAGLLWGTGPDLLAVASYALAAAGWTIGYHRARHPKWPDENLVKQMFPDS